ncbi:MAG: CapA family protein, partial [Candidatus Cloacimonetes bacterium]|nr:CapA family protein [Candidatus Cloacimonadota bacterium]
MKHIALFIVICLFAVMMTALPRHLVIEDFEFPDSLASITDYDVQPDSMLISPNGYIGNCLYLFGNTGKQSLIRPFTLQRGAVLQVSVYSTGNPALVAVGISDSLHSLRYSLYGSQEVNIEEFVPVYQGSKVSGEWINFLLPVSDDWFAWYDYLPIVSGIEFILQGAGEVFFDEVYDITEDINQPPECTFSYQMVNAKNNRDGTRDITYQFTANGSDPEGQFVYMYNWNFGDGTIISNEFDRTNHTFSVTDDHSYTVMLSVSDSLGARGYFTSTVDVEQGDSSLPIKLNFVGDVMFARRMTTYDIPNIFSDVDSVLNQVADFTIANLETPLADTGTMHPTKSVAYRSAPETVVALENAGIDIVSLANNHTMDFMEPALQQTRDVLDNHNILYCGAGMNSEEAYLPTLVSEKGMVIAFLGCSDRTGQYNNAQPYLQAGYDKAGFAYMTPYYLTEQLNSVDDIADLKIVMMHGGSEYSTQPGSNYDKFVEVDEDEDFDPRMDIPHLWDIDIRHHAIDAGADLVVVHHPHKIQAIEVYNGKVIAHSLGNFVFDLNYPECFPSMILNADAYEDGFRYFTVTPI